MRALILAVFVAAIAEASSTPSSLGLIGGVDFNDPYAALISPSGIITNLPNGGGPFPVSGQIISCAMNANGQGLLGGFDGSGDNPAYSATVSPSGFIINISPADLPTFGGAIVGCAINTAGTGLIAGYDNNGSVTPYGAFVTPSGVVTNLSADLMSLMMNGQINGCAINSNGIGLVGGENVSLDAPFAAVVFSSSPGTVINVPNSGDLFPAMGGILCTSINDNGTGLIGGFDSISTIAFAAYVSSSGALTNITMGDSLPLDGQIKSCAINKTGTGLIGGGGLSTFVPTQAYAAIVSTGVVSNLLVGPGGLPLDGIINSCAINSAGVGLIGGRPSFGSGGSGPAYAALVSPSGVLTNLPIGAGALPLAGSIESCAINEAGIGLIGGFDDSLSSAYAAIVSPLGVVTNLPIGTGNLPSNGGISCVANADALLNSLAGLVPTSIGPYGGAINSLFAASYALESHVMIQHKRQFRLLVERNTEISLLAAAGRTLPYKICKKETPYSIWVEPFGEYIHLKAQDVIPSLSNQIAGALAAFDAHVNENVFGGGLAYAFNYVRYSQGLGHAKINEELAVIYGSFQWKNIFLNATFWGGLYQVDNVRHTLGFITSKAKMNGWLLSPHIEISSPQTWNCYFTLEPFVMADWANNWQKHFTEHGASGLNLTVPNQYSSLLRSEAGLRFYEQITFCWGRMIIEEKASYINQTPFDVQSANTFFVGAASSFSVVTGTKKTQSLGGAEFHLSFIPQDTAYPYFSIDAQGEFGSSYQSYFAGFEIGKNF